MQTSVGQVSGDAFFAQDGAKGFEITHQGAYLIRELVDRFVHLDKRVFSLFIETLIPERYSLFVHEHGCCGLRLGPASGSFEQENAMPFRANIAGPLQGWNM